MYVRFNYVVLLSYIYYVSRKYFANNICEGHGAHYLGAYILYRTQYVAT